MTVWHKFIRDDRGTAAVEMAFSLPILVMIIYGMMQVGMVMAADAGMQHGLGEGARLATIYPTPTDVVIKEKVEAKLFGKLIGNFVVDDPVTTTSGTSKYKNLKVTYTATPNLIFFNTPSITLVREKRVYLSL